MDSGGKVVASESKLTIIVSPWVGPKPGLTIKQSQSDLAADLRPTGTSLTKLIQTLLRHRGF
jgi:hypothetical protein